MIASVTVAQGILIAIGGLLASILWLLLLYVSYYFIARAVGHGFYDGYGKRMNREQAVRGMNGAGSKNELISR